MIVYDTCDAIWECFIEKHMPFPSVELLEKSARDYEQLWNFPNCVASIDGKHIRVKCPDKTGSKHYNYKGFFSVILQGLVDATYKFLSVDIGAYGRQSDSGVFTESNLYKHLQTGSFPFPKPKVLPGTNITLPHVILGDQGYPLKEYLMRPYPTGKGNVLRDIEVYNYRHSRARRTVECAFGILVAKWRFLKTELQVQPDNVDRLVRAACLLHNIVINQEGFDENEFQKITTLNEDGSTNSRPKRYNRAGRDAYYIRDQFKIYFSGEGATDFQNYEIDTYTD